MGKREVGESEEMMEKEDAHFRGGSLHQRAAPLTDARGPRQHNTLLTVRPVIAFQRGKET